MLFDSLWITLLFLAAVIAILFVYLSAANKHWEKLGVPCPKPELFFGNTRRTLFVQESFPATLHRIYEELEGYPFGGLYMMMTPSIILRDPTLINRILVGDFAHFSERIDFPQTKVDPLSNHLCILKGSLWKEIRQRMSQAFSVSHTRRVFFLVQECCARLQTSVQAAMNGQPSRDFELKDLLSSFTTDVIGMCAFGIECGAIDNAHSQFRRIGSMIYGSTSMDAFRKMFNFMLPKAAMFFGLKFYSSSVAEFFDRIVIETIQYREKNGIVRDDLIQLMMKLKQGGLMIGENGENTEITDKFLVSQMLMAFSLGFEMTSSAMSFCLHELSLNPDVQNKARMEVDAVLSRHDGQLTYEALQEMAYLDMVLAETMRLYPPMGHLVRRCTEPYRIPGSSVVLQRGTQVFVPTLSLHRDKRFFPDPLRFNPERFRRDAKTGPHIIGNAYLPFGNGPRSCLGEKFALVEVKAGLAALLSHFEFCRCPRSSGSPAPFEKLKFLGCPAGGLWVRVAPRTWLPFT